LNRVYMLQMGSPAISNSVAIGPKELQDNRFMGFWMVGYIRLSVAPNKIISEISKGQVGTKYTKKKERNGYGIEYRVFNWVCWPIMLAVMYVLLFCLVRSPSITLLTRSCNGPIYNMFCVLFLWAMIHYKVQLVNHQGNVTLLVF
jgi:hypothetical protein